MKYSINVKKMFFSLTNHFLSKRLYLNISHFPHHFARTRFKLHLTNHQPSRIKVHENAHIFSDPEWQVDDDRSSELHQLISHVLIHH